MSAVWFFTVAIGNVLVAIVALYTAVYVGLELLIFALVIFMIGGIFVGISIRYRYKSQVTAESIQGYD
jgi:dipeptide/tripeptide permease